ncbi:DNA primase [Filobacillus milosensis]|uniref:DNA primase n=1 Tax=Filobacillus milosensis TaxID=94137 RepID=A0A4Y8ISR1_9BACI|nr:DNA primase [Filobacillus milosensis]TFB24832.1 DNA primase [Filobacillus milosensis]
MSYKIPQETIDQITGNNDIVDVISEHMKLTKKGRNYFGLCPFHGEDTPSFSVSPEKQIFHCFGCGKGGNVATFLMEIENISFSEALKTLADKSGDQLPAEWLNNKPRGPQYSNEQQDVIKAYEWSNKLFHHVLKHTKDGKDALNYLKNRGFSDDSIEHFQLGYSPRKEQFLGAFLKGKGFELEKLVDYGLLNSRDGNSFFDRFQGRVIFPIHNHQGKVIGYGGRAIYDGDQPKYLNSPESNLFQKGKILYNFYQARKHFQKQKRVILFEGYADVIKAYQAGVPNGVATMGTSLTDTHAKILKQYVDEIIICFDGDKAGKEASFKASKILKKAGLFARIANVPNEMDPDDYYEEHGAEAFQKLINSAESYVAFSLQYIKKDYNLSVDHDRVKYIEKALDIISNVNQAVERDFYLTELEETFKLDRNTLNHEIDSRMRIMRQPKDNDKHVRKSNYEQNNWNKNQKLYSAYQNAERHLIAHMLQNEHIADRVQQRLGSSFNIEDHQVLVTYLYAYYEEGNEPNVSYFIERLPDESTRQLTIELALLPINESLSDQELEDYFLAINKENEWSKEMRTLKQMLKQAEKENDPQSAARIGMKIIELKKKSIT